MSKKKKKYYFTKEHEEAIIKYNNTDSQKEKNKLYREMIGPVFEELIEQVVYTYKFTALPNVESLQVECQDWLITIIHKFDPTTGSKAFAYFTVIVKNWFIAKIKKRSKKLERESTYEDIPKYFEDELVEEHRYYKKRERKEFIHHLKEEVNTWDEGRRGNLLGKNDELVVTTLQDLLDSADDIEIFNKKAIYLYIREATGLNTKQITRSLKKLKKRYERFKSKWDDGEI